MKIRSYHPSDEKEISKLHEETVRKYIKQKINVLLCKK